MNQKQKTLKLEIKFQDTDVPIYTDFGNVEKGYAVLFGTNKKNLEMRKLIKPSYGKIGDGNGVEIEYVPFLDPSNRNLKQYAKLIEKSMTLPLDSPIWVFGKFLPAKKVLWRHMSSRIIAYDLGKKEEFIRPDLLK